MDSLQLSIILNSACCVLKPFLKPHKNGTRNLSATPVNAYKAVSYKKTLNSTISGPPLIMSPSPVSGACGAVKTNNICINIYIYTIIILYCTVYPGYSGLFGSKKKSRFNGFSGNPEKRKG